MLYDENDWPVSGLCIEASQWITVSIINFVRVSIFRTLFTLQQTYRPVAIDYGYTLHPCLVIMENQVT